jgi:hypothetical protein
LYSCLHTLDVNIGKRFLFLNYETAFCAIGLNLVIAAGKQIISSTKIPNALGFQVFFVVLSIPWFISIIFFSVFDTECIIFEQASVVNCSQEFFTASPEHWILAWLSMSMVASVLFLLIVRLNHRKLNYQVEKLGRIYKKGSFCSLVFLLFISSVYYIIRTFTKSDKMSTAILALLFFWPLMIAAVVCCVNYLPRVHWTQATGSRFTAPWWKDCLAKNSNFIIYWLALITYFVETTCKLLSVMLDVAHDVAPLMTSKFTDEAGQFRGVMVIVIGFTLGLHARLFSFFWQKLFHGEKDLFSEPSEKLLEKPLTKKQQPNESEKTVHLEINI